jgi:hypothetical protein
MRRMRFHPQSFAASAAIVTTTLLLACDATHAHAQQPSAPAAPARTTGAITEADLRLRLGIIADDSTMGRGTGSRGDDAAARYVAAEFQRMGLTPAGEGGTFFQVVPLTVRRFDGARVMLRVGTETLVNGRDYLPYHTSTRIPWARPRPIRNAQVVYGGTVGDVAHMVDSATAAGRLVILSLDPGVGERGALALRLGVPARLRGAAGVALVALDGLSVRYREVLTAPQVRLDDGVRVAGEMPTPLLLSRAAARRLLGVAPESASVGRRGARVDGATPVVIGPPGVPARNVVAVLPGSDPALRNTFVSLSAHHDHEGFSHTPVDHDSLHAYMRPYERFRQASRTLEVTPEQAATIRVNVDSLRGLGPARPDSIFNGADDDGSGTVALLEIAERLAASPDRPRRSVLFLSHAAEERGLLGSGWYSAHPTVPRDSIVAEMDMDMVGRGAAADLEGGGPDYLELIGSRRQSTEFGDLIDTLNARRAVPFRINYAYDAHDHPEGDWCRADHYSYARYGIPVAAFSTSYHGDYHQVTDEARYIDYPHLAAIAGFVGDVAAAVARMERRPVLDHPKLADPDARCAQ